MVRWLVWTCGALVIVGALIRLFAAPAAGKDQASASGPAPSTPASTSPVDMARQFEIGLQTQLLKDGILTKPAANAPPDTVKAYEYVLEAKKNDVSDAQAIHAASERLFQEKKAEHEAELPPEAIERHKNTPRPINPPPVEPPFTEDPNNPVPKPPK